MEVRFVEGMRVSDAETVEVAKMVLLGKVNADIVMRLNRHGQPAVGLSGEDGALFEIQPHARAEEVGFVGEIERVDVDVLNHIAADYIPVIASAGRRPRGPLLQRQRRHRGGQGRGRARRVQGDLPHRRRRLARRSRRRVLAQLAGHGGRGRGRARLGRRRHAAEAGRLRRGGPRRRRLGAHHRRPPPALAAARAVHGCRHRNDGDPVSVEELQALEGRYAMDTYARAPVEFVRGEGATAHGLRGARVPRLLRRALGPQRRPLPPADRRGDHRAGGALRRELQPLLLRARDAAQRAARRVEPRGARLPLQLRRRGERVRDQAGPQARPRSRDRRARDRHPRRRLPRPHPGGARRDPAARPRRPLRPPAAGVRRRAPRRPRRAARRGRTSAPQR